jgi:hypothetical protein
VTYRGYRPRLLWGSTYQNALDPLLAFENANAWPAPREGSEEVQLYSGIEDASVVWDYYLRGDVRWIPEETELGEYGTRVSGWNGADGWSAALRWMGEKNQPILCPDSRNLLRSPSMDVAIPSARWATLTAPNVSATYSNDDDGIKAAFSATASDVVNYAFVGQVVPGIIAGESLSLSVAYRTANLVGAPTFRAAIEFYTAVGGSYVSEVNAALGSSASWSRPTTITGTVPSTATAARIGFYALPLTIGHAGEVWWRQAVLARRASDASAYVANEEFTGYVVRAEQGEPPLEPNARRRVGLLLRSSTEFTGY